MCSILGTLYTGDALTVLKTLPDESVQCCVTSPPYWGLRDYGTATWEGGDVACDHLRPPLGGDGKTSGLNAKYADDGAFDGKQHPRLQHYADVCGKCGARRIDAQLGLEESPDAYVAKMVEVFREVRRVLRRDGTCFLNLGDSFHNKQLQGIPWRVAFALQESYYTGTIRNEHDRIWLAAMIDGEGCMFIHKRKTGQSNGQGYERKHDSYGSGLEVANCHESIVRRCLEITGKGSICFQDKESRFKNRKQRLYRWNLRSNECRDVVREVYPYLVGKQHEARLLCGCPSSGEQAEATHRALMLLHNGGETDVDFPIPASMVEPGFYLRSDIIWSKLNPMPESVTDRPTKSHEYVFLLTKAATYYWDAEAVKEGFADKRMGNPGAYKWAYGEATGKGKGESSLLKENGRVEGWNADGAKSGRNLRSVWTIATQPFKGAHFATFPQKLAETCIKAGTSERGCCPTCGGPWERVVEKETVWRERPNQYTSYREINGQPDQRKQGISATTLGWRPTCSCGETDTRPCVVLDPFSGAGTTGLVATRLGRDYIGIELNPAYNAMAKGRIENMLVTVNVTCVGH